MPQLVDRLLLLRTAVSIAGDGTVSGAAGILERLQVVGVKDEQELRQVGGGLFASAQDPLPMPTGTQSIQGTLDSSNVSPVLDMTEMMATSRAYQSTHRLIETHQELQRQVARRTLDLNN